MISVEDFYKKDCDDKERCLCKPEKMHDIACDFSKHSLITDKVSKLKLLQDFGYKLPEVEQEQAEAMAYIEEFPIYILKEGDVICHSTEYEQLVKRVIPYFSSMNVTVNREIWWLKYFPGQRNYKGAWFTYKTNYGGPDFGLNLYYKISKDIPLLFVPNYKAYYKKYYNEYFKEREQKEYSDRYMRDYTGSHVVPGPRDWKKKGFKEIIPKYYADELAERLVNLGFFGYISCDECEIFITHNTMEKIKIDRPFKTDFGLNKDTETNRKIFDFIIEMYCGNNVEQCPLKITEKQSRNEASDFVTYNIQLTEEGKFKK